MAEKVTYYLGAGASAQAIPVLGEDFKKRFLLFCEWINEMLRMERHKGEPKLLLEEVINDYPSYQSPDTYAKMYFLRNKQRYKGFKYLLSYYLIFEQFFKPTGNFNSDNLHRKKLCQFVNEDWKYKDPRYDVLFAALLNSKEDKLPKNMNIISWNYDLQLEISYSAFSGLPIDEAQKALGVYPNLSTLDNEPAQETQIVKLNGTAGLFTDTKNSRKLSPSVFGINTGDRIFNDCVGYLKEDVLSPMCNTALSFAWDTDNDIALNARKRAKQLLTDTDKLVVIGYSFPLYNRTSDREILNSLNPHADVIFQVPPQSYNDVVSQFEHACDIERSKLRNYSNTNQFYVPPGLL